MKKKFAKRFLSWVMAAAMVISMLPLSAMAAEGDVAQIGDKTYATLDDAIAAASAGDTIILLGDATLSKTLDKSITIDGQNHTVTSTNVRYGFSTGRSLTFKNVTMNFNYTIEIENPTYTSDLSLFYVNGDTDFTFDNSTINMTNTGATNRLHGFYYDGGSGGTITVKNHSTLNITGLPEDAIEWSGNADSNLIIEDSTYISDHNRSGIAGTWNVTITRSKVEVTNSIGNGSNGSHYTITDSTVNYSNNGSHGLSAGDLIIKNSTVTAENNGYYGAYSSRNFLVDSTSKLIVTKNSAKGDFAGLKLTGGVTDGKVEAGAIVTITDNYCSGLSNNGKCTFAEGANLTIMNNNNDKGTTSNGGGIYNSGASANLTLPSNAVIYNNHADTAGDDIFNNTTATITFGKVGSDWVLDGDPDCEHMINGWYDDSANNRWAVHPEDDTDSVLDEDTMHAVVFDKFENGLATVTGLTALKAAHGAKFEDKFSYPGLDKQVGDDDEPMNDEDVDAAAGQTVNFQLTSNVPDDLRNYLKPEPVDPPVIEGEPEGTPAPGVPADENRGSYTLTFHDVMDTEHKMLVDPENFVVTVGGETENGTELPVINLTEMNLSEDVYNITQNPADGCTFEITLDLAKLYELGKAENIDVDAYIDNAAPITVTYQATLSEDAVSGQFENKAWVTAPEDWKTSEDVVYVNTYAIDIYKYKQGESETGLSGAEFVLKKGDETVREGITSGENGHVVVGGLDKGEYTLTETKAPEGYVCSETPLDIKIPTDAGTGFVVNVSFANSLIPHTGGMGTTLFSIVGGALIVMAGTIFVISRRKRRA